MAGHHSSPWCPHASSPFDIEDGCIRDAWSSIAPGAVVGLLCTYSAIRASGITRRVPESLKEPFKPFISVEEAEAIDADESDPTPTHSPPQAVWRTLVFATLGLLQTLVWLALGAYNLYLGESPFNAGLFSLLIAATWAYTVIRTVLHRGPAPPYDVLIAYVAILCGAVLKVGGELWQEQHDWSRLGWASAWSNLVVVLVTLSVLLSMPLNHLSETAKAGSSSPEDYTSLFGWITFSWVYPLVQSGRFKTLNEDDVWNLSPAFRSKPVFTKFSEIKKPTLLRRLWIANSLDLLLDFILTFISIIFQYSGPVFLKLILDAINERGTTKSTTSGFFAFSQIPLVGSLAPTSQSNAYIYAVLAFVCTLCKAEADLQHLWYGRRAATRMRSELMAAIYDKALKRRDYAGIVSSQAPKADEEAAKKQPSEASSSKKMSRAERKKEKKAQKLKKEKAEANDEPKAGADVGKIVNLMAGDANRISQTISALYFIYGAPLEIIIAGFLLYQLLGLSAFAGFFVLILGWPLNSYISKRSIRIQKGVLSARDGRMGVLNELIGAVKFIKFFAWEDRWIERALDAREKEMKWMVKARVNSVMFYLLWTLAPILVSIISFMTYVMQGNELSVSVAFTSIALFNMVRTPLNVIPSWIVQILQTGVALKRIAVYLDEDEVDEQVSSLKQKPASFYSSLESRETDDGLGLENATLRWNEVPKDKDMAQGDEQPPSPSSTSGTDAGDVEAHAQQPSSSDTANDADLLAGEGAEPTRFELKDITVRFPEGKLSVVTGPTASGKTALLMAVLGELTLLSGRIIMRKDLSEIDENGLMHSISYASQSPWLRHQSIKENILFGQPLDEERYQEVIDACALRMDLDILEDGDETEIGARGVSLSGGQKARVALARAVYTRTKYVLLDDPLSAVDSHTSRVLYEKLLRGPLLANRTVVLVTHHVELVLPGAHYLIRMLDGRIDAQGTVQDLRARGMLDHIAHDASTEVHNAEIVPVDEEAIKQGTMEGGSASPTDVTATASTLDTTKKPRKLIKEEHRETGGVKWSIYKSYLKASSYWIWGFLAFMVVVVQILGAGEKLWITVWGEAYNKNNGTANTPTFMAYKSFAAFPEHDSPSAMGYFAHHHHLDTVFQPLANSKVDMEDGISATSLKGIFGYEFPNAVEHPLFYVGVYAGIGFAIALANVLSVTAQYTAALRASRVLFKQLLITVVRATFRFHDTTPQGRMLNRFGKDIETIDSSLAGSLQAVNSSLASFFAAIVIIAVVFPYFLVPAALIGLAYRELAIGYLNTGRDLRRMESNTRSPIFSDFGELLEGIVTVRAFSAERRFLNSLHQKIDNTTKMWYAFWMTNRWLLLNFDALGALAVLVTSLFSIATLSKGAGLAGLCITSAMTFTSSVYWACRFWTALELDLNSVERVVEYLDLPQEPPAVIESNRAPAYWPSGSKDKDLVTVENLVIKYAPDLPAVLRDVSFTLKGSERIGLLGRTGSGKSTLAMSILRFVDPVEGRILIDGIDISTIGIHDLRSRVTFIPQDATLFSGTLRENLDPFGEHTDADCLDVLRRVHMISESGFTSGMTSREQSAAPSRAPSIIDVEREDGGSSHGGQAPSEAQSVVSVASSATEVDPSRSKVTLDTKVSAGGTNFSQGQRQLIAMARALLRKSSIIVLDEATSSIDFATDAKIQTTIREEFGGSLLLTVAHRLRTVIDYDRLIVLDKGQIVEFDTPYNLIQKEEGTFRQMCLKSGTFAELEAAAKAKAEAVSVP
ncbi:multidrug resistance-associated ABC transporter [Coprinopsis sp. MPI-PUGE-AT-0042]|nr:multidrug resistance-associated ABC transporter [Coprinopsis sp. MPI-PUGE-AT-0042]